jgi:phosphate transport system protein
MINEKIAVLKEDMMKYAYGVEEMTADSCKGIFKRKEEILRKVIEEDENIANKCEIEFDEACIDFIAKYQPVARNLRIIISLVKMSSILERMADHAVNIAQNGLFLIKQPEVKSYVDFPKMSALTVQMLKNSIKSFVDEDTNLAKNVLLQDNEIDAFKFCITKKLSLIMSQDAKMVEACLKLISIVSNLERIADLATNICEDTIYLAQGIVVKHSSNPFSRFV